MAFTRPSLETLVNRAKGDFRDTLNIAVVLRRSLEEAFAIAIAGATHTLHSHIRFVARQIFPNLAEGPYLERWAAVYDISKNVASIARIKIEATGVDGTVISLPTTFLRSDGEAYDLEAGATISSGVAELSIISQKTGSNVNVEVGDVLTLESPLAGVDSSVTVTEVVEEAEDTETNESLQERVVSRIRNPPSGGTVTDYISYAREVSGVTRAWVLPNWPAAGFNGEGGVGVTFVEDNEDPIIPSAAKVAEVQTNVNVNKPVTADALVFAPNPNTVDIHIKIKPNTAEVRANVDAELKDLFAREGQVAGAVNPDFIATGVTYSGGLSLSKITEAISVAEGEEEHQLVTPSLNVISSAGQIITLGNVTYETLA